MASRSESFSESFSESPRLMVSSAVDGRALPGRLVNLRSWWEVRTLATLSVSSTSGSVLTRAARVALRSKMVPVSSGLIYSAECDRVFHVHAVLVGRIVAVYDIQLPSWIRCNARVFCVFTVVSGKRLAIFIGIGIAIEMPRCWPGAPLAVAVAVDCPALLVQACFICAPSCALALVSPNA